MTVPIPRSYDIMWAYARTQLRVGLSCVVDCPLGKAVPCWEKP